MLGFSTTEMIKTDFFNARASWPPRNEPQSEKRTHLQIADRLYLAGEFKLLTDPKVALRYFRIALSLKNRYYTHYHPVLQEIRYSIESAKFRIDLLSNVLQGPPIQRHDSWVIIEE